MRPLHAVIMAGGAGTRFWPLSRRGRPKQVLPLAGKKPLVAETVDRLARLVPPGRIWIVTGEDQRKAIGEALPRFPRARIVAEPFGRDTAAAVALGAALVGREEPDAVIAVLPADHAIAPAEAFRAALGRAAGFAARGGGLLTFGIRPSGPATQYGYIERGAPAGARGLYRAQAFHEKPDAPRARRYLRTGRFYWNAGIFVWRADAIRAAIAEHLPIHARTLSALPGRPGSPRFRRALARAYGSVPRISIDYGVMEPASRRGSVYVAEASFRWSDVGSFSASAARSLPDRAENRSTVPLVARGARRCLAAGTPGHLVALVGVEDLLVVSTPDATLVCPRERESEAREVVKEIERRGWTPYL